MRTPTFALALFFAPVALAPSAASAADPAVERLFKTKCAACHGADGKGATKQGEKMKIRDMTTQAWKKEFPEAKIRQVIAEGVSREKDGVKQEMKPMKDKLKPEEIEQLAAYAASLK